MDGWMDGMGSWGECVPRLYGWWQAPHPHARLCVCVSVCVCVCVCVYSLARSSVVHASLVCLRLSS
jgi:hypothetical protein